MSFRGSLAGGRLLRRIRAFLARPGMPGPDAGCLPRVELLELERDWHNRRGQHPEPGPAAAKERHRAGTGRRDGTKAKLHVD